MTETIWKQVPGLDVEASQDGDLRGYCTDPYLSHDGYWRTYVSGVLYLVHRLVCQAFHGDAPVDRPLALHSNDVKSDNRSENLRWGNARENALDARRNGITIGPDAWRSKQSPQEEYRDIIARLPDARQNATTDELRALLDRAEVLWSQIHGAR